VQGDELLAHLRRRVPEYMLPAAFVVLDALPINENGKLDRRRLPRAAGQQLAVGDHAAPRTSTEKAIAAMWCELLELPTVGVNDSFFDLGGHSMLAVKIVSTIKERFSIELAGAALFHAPTIATLAHVVDALLAMPQPRGAASDHEVIEL
jgi:acyl carrier protein